MLKTPVGYVLIFFFFVAGGGAGVESRPVVVDGGRVCKKGPFMATKWAQNGVSILVGLDLDIV